VLTHASIVCGMLASVNSVNSVSPCLLQKDMLSVTMPTQDHLHLSEFSEMEGDKLQKLALVWSDRCLIYNNNYSC